MAPLPFMPGLLDQNQSLAPNIGGGADPVKAMLARMAMQQPQVRGPTGQPQDAQLPAPGPFAPPGGAGGQPGGAQGAPPAPPPPRPAPPKTPRPLPTATQAALFHAGEAVVEAPTLAHAVARGLSSGIRAFRETKSAQAAEENYRENFERALSDPNIPPGLANLIRSAEAVERGRGLKLYEEVMKEDLGYESLTPGQTLVRRGTGETIARGANRTAEAGGRIFDIGTDAEGRNVATPLTDRAIPDATSLMREFVGQYTDEALDPNDYPNWSNAAKNALNEFVKEDREGRGTRVSVNTNVLPPGAEHLQERLFSQAADRINTDYNRVLKGQLAEASLGRVEELIDQGSFVGPAADPLSAAVLFAQRFTGLNVGANKAEATQAIRAHLLNVVIPRLEEMGTRPSDRDLMALQASIGTTDYTPDVLREIVRLQRNYISRYQNEYNRDWVAMQEQARSLGIQLPANLRPVGAASDEVVRWSNLTPEQRQQAIARGAEDPTAEIPYLVTRFVGQGSQSNNRNRNRR